MVCIKRLHPSIPTNTLLQECRSLARLDHPNIVRVLDFGVQHEEPFLVTEFIDGPTLADHLSLNPQPPVSFTLALARALFSAVDYAHQRQIIHRDLKPGNVLLEPGSLGPNDARENTPKLVDFGLAIVDLFDAEGNPTASGQPAGTPAYMPPEQFEGARLSDKCDVYAIGVILWEMIVGRRAFPSRSWYDVAGQKRAGPLILRAEGPVEVPTALRNLISECTNPTVENRPSAAEACATLSEF
jgi:serine/threonine-protein kinase